jgi:hypothetical protein
MGYQTNFTGTLKFTRLMSKVELAFIKTIANYDVEIDVAGWKITTPKTPLLKFLEEHRRALETELRRLGVAMTPKKVKAK